MKITSNSTSAAVPSGLRIALRDSCTSCGIALRPSMILTGMGPVARLPTPGSKVFASFYALYSGVAFLSAVGVLFVPVVHRILHRFHLALDEEEEDPAPDHPVST